MTSSLVYYIKQSSKKVKYFIQKTASCNFGHHMTIIYIFKKLRFLLQYENNLFQIRLIWSVLFTFEMVENAIIII